MATAGQVIYLPNRYEKANFLSRNFQLCVWGFLRQNYGKRMKASDLEVCPQESKSDKLGSKLDLEWKKERQKSSKPSFTKAVFRCFGLRYAILSIIIILNQCVFMIMQTLCMGWLVQELALYDPHSTQDDQDNARWRIYWYGFGVIAFQAALITTIHPYLFGTSKLGMDVRIACCNLIYKKSLKLSKSALSKTTIGQIVNLLSNDVNRFDMVFNFPPYIIAGPICTIIVTLLLYFTEDFGTDCLPGIAILLLYIPFQACVGKMFTGLRIKTAKLTDERVRLTSEFVKAMKVIKMYAWEIPFTKLVNDKRREEVSMIRKACYLRGINLGLFFISTKIILFVMLFLYVWRTNSLSSEAVFVAMGLINQLRLTVCLFIPYAISLGAEALVSLKRIQNFLLLDEVGSNNVGHILKHVENIPSSKSASLEMKNICAGYKLTKQDSPKEDYIDQTLSDLSFDVSPNQLFMIIGTVGSGKSSILMTILNELPIISGSLKINGKISYSAQEAWTIPGTIKDNIIFGSTYNKDRYQKVIDVCALRRDLSLFPDGDQTRVGDSGLSGGQRARVNLARALYIEADIYLLDDPLSAVDASVAKHIFEKAIRGFLSDKIVILVTHQLQFVKSCDKLILLKAGRSEVYGTYEDLLSRSVDFMDFNLNQDKEEETPMAAIPQDIITSNSFESEKFLDGNLVITPGAAGDGYRSYQRSISRQNSLHSSIKSHVSIKSNKSHYSSEPYRSRTSTMIKGTKDQNKDKEDQNQDKADDVFGNEQKFEDINGAASKTYWTYISAGGGCFTLFLIICTMWGCQFVFTFSDWWLSQWTNYVEHKELQFYSITNISSNMIDLSMTNLSSTSSSINEDCNDPNLPSVLYCHIEDNSYFYLAQTLLVFALALIRTIVFFLACMRASVKLHDRLFKCLVRAPMSFFDNNPIGALLNRCSRDIGIIDDILPPTLFDASSIIVVDIASAILICFIDYWILIPTVVLIVVFIYVRKMYVSTARNVKKLEGITRSPVFSHLATSLNGLTTIRATRSQERFIAMFDYHQDNHSSAWFHFMSCLRWLGINLDWLCASYIAAIVISMLSNLSGTNGASVGLAITSAILLANGFQWGIRQSTEAETQMTSVERVDEYSHLESEKYHDVDNDNYVKPPDNWPSTGQIDFRNVSLTYHDEDGPVLKNLTFKIEGSEKIGIVGRTGAGKSSIINCLFRLTEPSGDGIYIDGINTQKVNLHDLRRKISIIPQEPVLFSGTIRKNLDPFDEIQEDKLWHALEEVQLKHAVSEIPGGLLAIISEEQCPFSVGQRQLVCMARAIIRQNKILILDEATANIDPRTDSLIQETIRRSFASCTILTIAHRLDTIIDADRVLVLDAGRVIEFDEPFNLLKDEKSIFSAMCRSTGPQMAERLQVMAQRASELKTLASHPNDN